MKIKKETSGIPLIIASVLFLAPISLAGLSVPAMADEASDWCASLREEPKSTAKPKQSAASKAAAAKAMEKKAAEAWTGGKDTDNSDSSSEGDEKPAKAKRIKAKASDSEITDNGSGAIAGDKDTEKDGSRASIQDGGSNEYGTLNTLNAASLRGHAKNHLKKGHVKTALKLIEEAVDIDRENSDGHQIYAETLDAAVRQQSPRDPETFNKCIKQWYYCYKHADFPEDSTAAAQKLKALTGKAPQVWMRAKSYLSSVMLPVDDDDSAATEVSSAEPAQVP